MIRLLTMVLSLCLSLQAHSATAQNPIVMRISHPVPATHHLAKMLEIFAAEVKARTNGEVVVQLEAAEHAFKASQNIAAVQKGEIEAAVSTNFRWGGIVPEILALNLPYVFEHLDDIRRFPTSKARRYLDGRLGERGVKSLAWFYISRQTIYTSNVQPVIALDDLKGKKIRGFNKLLDSGFSSIGAYPTAMPAPEVVKALLSGKLDVGMTDLSAAYSRKFYEVQRYGTVTPNYMVIYFVMYANPAWFDALSQKNRDALRAAAAKAEQDAVPITEQAADEAIDALREKGMIVHVLSLIETSVWKRALSRPTWLAFLKSAPEGGQKVLTLLNDF